MYILVSITFGIIHRVVKITPQINQRNNLLWVTVGGNYLMMEKKGLPPSSPPEYSGPVVSDLPNINPGASDVITPEDVQEISKLNIWCIITTLLNLHFNMDWLTVHVIYRFIVYDTYSYKWNSICLRTLRGDLAWIQDERKRVLNRECCKIKRFAFFHVISYYR